MTSGRTTRSTRKMTRSGKTYINNKETDIVESPKVEKNIIDTMSKDTNVISPTNSQEEETNAGQTTSEFKVDGVEYSTYEEMVIAKRKRNNAFLESSGLLNAVNNIHASNNNVNINNNMIKATSRGLKQQKKRKAESLPEPRRKSSRLSGKKAADIYVVDERGGRITLNNNGFDVSNNSNGAILEEEEKERFFNNRVNDGSDINVQEAVELSDSKWIKENSVSSAQDFIKDICESVETSRKSTGDTFDNTEQQVESPSVRLSKQADEISVDDVDICVAKVVPDRIYSVAFNPMPDRLLATCGDKQGYIGFWDIDKQNDDASNGVHLFKPHANVVSNLSWTKNGQKLMSSSYDGSVRLFDLNTEVFTEIFATYDSSSDYKEKLGYGIDKGYRFWTQYCCFDTKHGGGDNCLYLSTSIGELIHVDLRQKGSVTFTHDVSEKKVNTISIHPDENILATCGLDCTLNLWDVRKLHEKKSKKSPNPLCTYINSKSINSAFFSPSGKHILTTTMSNTLDIFTDAHLQNSENLNKSCPPHRINHDNRTGRWLTTFNAQWHTGLKQEDIFVSGSMRRPRTIELFNSEGKKLRDISGDGLTAVASRCCFHPSTEQLILLGGNSSGRLTVAR